MWQKSIKNHLYCGIQNVHVHENPLFPKCLHPPSTDKNKWLKATTKATYKLEKVLMNNRVLGDVKKLSPLYQTSALEGFHMILRFHQKTWPSHTWGCSAVFCCDTRSSFTREELQNIRRTIPADLFPTFLLPSVELLDILVKGALTLAHAVKRRRPTSHTVTGNISLQCALTVH